MRTSTNTSFKEWQVLPPFSLTSTLSRGERENHSPAQRECVCGDCSEIIGKSKHCQLPFPFPQGESQGEGEFYTNFSAKFILRQP